MTRFTLFIGILALTLAACDSTDPIDETRVEANVVADLAADPGVRDQTTGVVNDTGRYTLYSLRDGEVVLSYDEADRSDSLTTAWDVGFRGTTIIVNGGASGPGNAGAVVLEEAYDDVMAVPASASFRVDGTAACPTVQTQNGPVPGPSLAVCTGGGNGWYTYVPFPGNMGGYIVPTPGRTLLVRTADGDGYAKVRFESYYQGAPEASEITATSQDRFYTFEYVVNPFGRTFDVSSQ